MTRLALAATIFSTLSLNGSMAAASMPEPIGVCTSQQRLCQISLRMMVPPPPRPAHITAQLAAPVPEAPAPQPARPAVIRASVAR